MVLGVGFVLCRHRFVQVRRCQKRQAGSSCYIEHTASSCTYAYVPNDSTMSENRMGCEPVHGSGKLLAILVHQYYFDGFGAALKPCILALCCQHIRPDVNTTFWVFIPLCGFKAHTNSIILTALISRAALAIHCTWLSIGQLAVAAQ